MDPWDLLDPLQADGSRLMAWASPDGSQSFVAIGEVSEFRPTGPERFEASKKWWIPLLNTIETTDALGRPAQSNAPLCLAGFAFRADPNRSDAWSAWGDGALCIPQILVWRSNNATEVNFVVRNDPALRPQSLAELQDQLSEWMTRSQPIEHIASVDVAERDTTPENASTLWQQRVRAAQEKMATGQLQKVVLARSAAYVPSQAQRFDPLATARSLRQRQTRSTTFLIRRKDGQAFLGSSPEVLVRLDQGRVETVALAGTRKRSTESEIEDVALGADLLDSSKDRTEQDLVATAIVDALQPHVSDIDIPGRPEVISLPDVQHLRTAIHGNLCDNSSIFDLVEQLHPTPAVGGLPRQAALNWLDDHEHLDRGWYAGPIGWIGAEGNGEFVVAIRSVLMGPEEASAFAGCGLIADSIPEDEWEESQIKLQTVRQGLAVEAHVGLER